ncbi:DUF4249 domain-containing protein [Hymenobacter sp. BT664]|uniref:DUF4249 domain-containing protein n=1 Tax=Hymenobacter montanus TaxID=2771359 RepID=A0A927BD90_9BACT|nr:DUF4249 domain-containing protein [Hymenobacter montanus]MBD2767973.1 DUF4249 domain-containing protein [Hymenobacter montanus]
MNRFLLLLAAGLASCGLSSCLDVVPLDVPKATPLLSVDGQITDQGTPAAVTLSLTQPYFNDAPPPPVTGATLTLEDDQGRRDVLVEELPGYYRGSGTVLGRIGGRYTLTIVTDGQTYRAETEIRRTPSIDRIEIQFKEKQTDYDEGYYAFYYGPELPGVGDYYRFRIYKNGVLFNKPGDLIVSSDELVDGRYIGELRLNDKPLVRGDRIDVELLSIPRDYYYFLNEMVTQINNVGLFATSPANVRTNVRNTQAGSGKTAVGYFAGYTVRTASATVN